LTESTTKSVSYIFVLPSIV